MPTPKNHKKNWTKDDDRELVRLTKENTPTRVIALKMERTEDAVRSHAASAKISLKPTNRSPYG